jgi:hypothetical protein
MPDIITTVLPATHVSPGLVGLQSSLGVRPREAYAFCRKFSSSFKVVKYLLVEADTQFACLVKKRGGRHQDRR